MKIGLITLIVALSAMMTVRFITHPEALRTSLFDLLPHDERHPARQAAEDRYLDYLGRQIVVVVSHPNKEQAIKGVRFLEKAFLGHRDLVSGVRMGLSTAQQRSFFATFFNARLGLLNDSDRALAKRRPDQFVDSARARLYAPVVGIPSDLVVKDPFFLFSRYVEGLPTGNGVFEPDGDALVANLKDRWVALLTVTARRDDFGGSSSSAVVSLAQNAVSQVQRAMPGLVVDWIGIPRYAARAAAAARGEMSLIGAGSILGVTLLLLLVFRSVVPLLWTILAIAIGLLIAVAGTYLVFGQIHMLTLVFGASLIGVCVDYAFHFFVHHRFGDRSSDGAVVVRRILPAITMGLVTTIAGYVALSIAPFPGLRQMALFATCGLLGAFFSVVVGMGSLGARKTGTAVRPRIMSFIGHVANHPFYQSPRFRWGLLGVSLLTALPLWRLSADDDIRLLRAADAPMAAVEDRINGLTGEVDRSRFVLVTGADDEAVLQAEEKVVKRLASLQDKGVVEGVVATSMWVPSVKEQQASFFAVRKLFASKAANDFFTEIGLDQADVATERKALEQWSPLKIKQVAGASFLPMTNLLWLGKTGKQVASVIMLSGIRDGEAVREAVQGVMGASYVDKVGQVSELFKRYRQVCTWLLAACYGVIFLVLIGRYGLGGAMSVMAPPGITVLVILSGMALLRIPANIFTFLALLLVLAIGIDYTLFFAETKHERDLVGVAVFLSAVTTILSFGLLALGRTPAIAHLGWVIFVGIILCAVLSPLAKMRKSGHA